MISNTQEQSSNRTRIEIPPTDSTSNPQLGQPFTPTLYDYLALVPVLVTAATPLILGLRNKKSSEPDRLESKDND
ncbi:hypothetical protein SD81_023060 [Tolypothrix campylonemoides VB511288]|nr:hypothetical protein SD81_023060 [Tolypothrix campylonemoides VB511288]